MKYKIIIAVAVLFTIQATAQFNTFRGAGFEVNYPASFRAHGAPGTLELNPESVFFSSPDNLVEFYIFSPMHKGVATDIALKSNEKLAPGEVSNGKTTIAKFWTIIAKDNSYERTYQESIDVKTGDNWVIGLKYKNQAAFNKYRNEYLAFKKSYHKTGSSNAVQSSASMQKLQASFDFEEKRDSETNGTLTTVYLIYNGNKYKLETVDGTAEDIEKNNYKMSDVPNAAIAACGVWYGESATIFYVIQKEGKLFVFKGSTEDNPSKLTWKKVKEF
jgi:hypothetical protein